MRLRSAIADLRRQARNPYARSWLWIPGSRYAPRNDAEVRADGHDDSSGSPYSNSRRADPVAVKAVGHPMSQLHQRGGTGFDVGGVEDREIAAIFPRPPDHRQQPAVALGRIVAARDEYRLRDGVAGRQQVSAKARSPAIDMHQAGQRAEHRQIRVSAGVPAMMACETGAAIVDAREFAGDVVEIALRKTVGIPGEIEGPAAQPRARL